MASSEPLYHQHPFFVADISCNQDKLRFLAEDRVFDYRYYRASSSTEDTPPVKPANRSMPYWLNLVVILTSVVAGHLISYVFFD